MGNPSVDKVVDSLGEELKKASLARYDGKDRSSFRRLTKYEYDYALQDLLGIPYPLANKLPPEATTEDGFKNSAELLQLTGVQFETYREIALKSLKRATVSGPRPKAVTYIISMQQEMEAAGKDAKVLDQTEPSYRKYKNQPHLLNRETGIRV